MLTKSIDSGSTGSKQMDAFEDNNPFGLSDEAMPRPRLNESLQTSTMDSSGAQTTVPQSVVITDATKVRENGTRAHISYTIRVEPQLTVRRRYSDFESLYKLLRKLFPCLVVPPIPEKHSIRAYAVNPTHAQEDIRVIQLRKRSLGEFLNRCLLTPQICDCWALKKFLDPNVNWKEVLETEEVLKLPRSPLLGPPRDVRPETITKFHAMLPVPPASTSIRGDKRVDKKVDKKTDQDSTHSASSPSSAQVPESASPSTEVNGFSKYEQDAEEYEDAFGGGLEKRAQHVNKLYTTLFTEYAELGGQLNSFSLDSHGQFDKLAPAVEKVGQAMDQGYVLTSLLADKLGTVFNEPLVEYVRMAVTARQVLQYRRQREVQVAIVKDHLAALKKKLDQLQETESEVTRVNSMLNMDERMAAAERLVNTNGSAGSVPESVPDSVPDSVSESVHESVPESVPDQGSVGSRPGSPNASTIESLNDDNSVDIQMYDTPKSRFRIPGFSHINQAISGLMDADPQTTRRNSITRTREQIDMFKEVLRIAEQDAEVANSEVEVEIERYKHARKDDIRALVKEFIRCHVEWAEKNLESWIEAKQAIESS